MFEVIGTAGIALFICAIGEKCYMAYTLKKGGWFGNPVSFHSADSNTAGGGDNKHIRDRN